MLFISKKYESLDKLISNTVINESDELSEQINNETLTQKGIKELTGTLKSNSDVLDDKDVPQYTDRVLSFASKKTFNQYDEFFGSHGIAQFKNEIVQSFVENKCADILLDIIKGNGLIDKSKLAQNTNIYTLCKGFEDTARFIKGLIGQQGNKAEGEYETLLRLILKDGNKPKIGDVGIGSNVRVEVKKDGAHPYDQKTLPNKLIFEIVDEAFGPTIVDNSARGKINYASLRDKEPIKVFNERLDVLSKGRQRSSKRNLIKQAIVSGVAEQYILGEPTSAMNAIASEYNFNGEVSARELLALIGRLQLAAYLNSLMVNGFIILDNSGNYLYFDVADVAAKSDQIAYTTLSCTPSARAGAVMQLKK